MSALEQYAVAVLDGKIKTSRRIKQQYERLIYQLYNPGRWHFDQSVADRHVNFMERFCKNPESGAPLRFELFQRAKFEAIFGFVDDYGLRKHQEVMTLEGRKNGKTTEMSAVEIDLLVNDGEGSPQVYNVATKRDKDIVRGQATTTAAECPYCGSPTILPDRIEGGVKPEKVIPFVVTKEQAQKQFEDYFKGKKLLPNVFLNSRNRISEMRRLYVPYWLFSCDACADMVYDAEKVCTEQKGEWEITRTKHYLVRRRGGMRFENIPVDGSVKMDDKLTESLEPYDLSAAIPFQSAVLAGAMADHADADCDACEKRAVERVERSVEQTMLDTVRDYDTVNERSRRIVTERGSATPALLPVWLMTTVKEGKTYTFAVNGQTGKLTCDVPADKKKSLLWGGGVFAGVFGVAALILALMDALGSGSLLIGAMAAIIIALAVVGALKGQLKQAAQQSAAGGYVREGSFRLDVNADHFLYESTAKRKIENNTQKK